MDDKKIDRNSLRAYEDHWETNMGAWFAGERVVYRGKDLFTELNDLPWMGLLLYGITGQLFNSKQIQLFEGIWSLSTSFPEPRIWNNRIAALAGTAKSTASLGLAAALAASEAKIYGHQVNKEAVDFIVDAKLGVDKGEELTELIKEKLHKDRRIGGYGRPIIRTDERIEPLLKLAKKLDLANGPYVKFVFKIENILIKERLRMRMNIGALSAALALDQGLTSQEIYLYRGLNFSAGIIPCYIDASNKEPGAFFPLSCDRIQYEGLPKRLWKEE